MSAPDPWQAADQHALAELLLRRSMSHGVVFMDTAGTIRGCNRGMLHIHGFAPEELIGRHASVLFTEEDQQRGLAEQELRIAAEVGVAEDERWHVRKDGGRTWTTGVTMPLWDAAGTRTGFVKIFRDATHLRTRTKFLENALEACATRQGQHEYFVSSIAHELRNPLGPLKNGLQVLQRQAGGQHPFDRPLQMMDRQLGFLERLVEDLVDLIRVRTGKFSLVFAETDLGELVVEAVEAARHRAGARRLELKAVLPSVPLRVVIDGERMLQVISNLLNNAVKFTPDGGTVWISVTADQTHSIISVKDTGIGIAPDLLTRVFDAFTQAGHAATGRGDGLGLGLAVVKELVSLHKGTVEVRSEGVGKGSEFIVHVPLTPPEGSALEPLPRPERTPAP